MTRATARPGHPDQQRADPEPEEDGQQRQPRHQNRVVLRQIFAQPGRQDGIKIGHIPVRISPPAAGARGDERRS